MHTKFQYKNLNGIDHMGGFCVNERIILKWISKDIRWQAW
jgi:hypothetical protein